MNPPVVHACEPHAELGTCPHVNPEIVVAWGGDVVSGPGQFALPAQK